MAPAYPSISSTSMRRAVLDGQPAPNWESAAAKASSYFYYNFVIRTYYEDPPKVSKANAKQHYHTMHKLFPPLCTVDMLKARPKKNPTSLPLHPNKMWKVNMLHAPTFPNVAYYCTYAHGQTLPLPKNIWCTPSLGGKENRKKSFLE